MKFLNIYPDIDKLLKFNITFLFYYLQDMMTSPLLDKFIDKTIYHKIMDIYNIYSRTRLSTSAEKKYKDQILLYILKIIDNILDITDDYQHIRALAMNEIIHNNYEAFGDDSPPNNNTIIQPPPQLAPITPLEFVPPLQQNLNNILNLDDEMENVD
jgi:hypothetical protein